MFKNGKLRRSDWMEGLLHAENRLRTDGQFNLEDSMPECSLDIVKYISGFTDFHANKSKRFAHNNVNS